MRNTAFSFLHTWPPLARSSIWAILPLLLLAALFATTLTSSGAADANALVLVPVVDGLASPVFVTHAGDGSGRLFVVEKGGTIRIVQNGQVLATPFLDITDRVSNVGEAGLLSVAFPPDYVASGVFYVYYNHKSDLAPPEPIDAGHNAGFDTVIARFHVTTDANLADPASEERILIRNQPYTNHNGGLITFGPDGYLYIGLGDGGSGGDPQNQAQNLGTLLGKLLRIQVAATGTYTTPTTNPFVGTAGAKGEIWDYGLRNPWRWSFDRTTGDLYIGDVGQGLFEEVSFHASGPPAGINFGWRCREGLHAYNETPPCPSPLTDPIAEYNRTVGNSITGGYVYRGQSYAALRGIYFYADFGSGRILSLRQTATGWTTPTLELDTALSISSFGEDEAGELYVVDFSGAILHLTTTLNPAPDLGNSRKSASPANVQPGGLVLYTVRIENDGGAVNGAVAVTDVLPVGLTYVPGSITATAGIVDDTQAPHLAWNGAVQAGQAVTIDYQAIVAPDAGGRLVNSAQVTGGPVPLSLSSVVTVTPASGANPDFFLPGTQPGQLVDAIADPAQCQGCHSAPIYEAWRGSMMSQAGRDPLLWAALAAANADAPGSGEFCLRCHTPKGWFEGHSHPADGSALQPSEIGAGVACESCHRMVDPVPTAATDQAAARDTVLRAAISPTVPISNVSTAMIILDPLDNRRGPFAITPTPPHPRATWRTDFLGQGANPVTEARVCGSCHNLDNPTLSWDPVRNQYWPNANGQPAPAVAKGDLFPVERTYDEWLNSTYATAAGVLAPQFAGSKPDGIVRTCQDCHMPRRTGSPAIGDVVRDCTTNGCLPEHTLVGGNTWVPQLLQDSRWRLNAAGDSAQLDAAIEHAQSLLQRAATITVTLSGDSAGKQAIVRVTNEAGHKLPTGYAEGRRMWLTVQAFDGAGQVVFTSGAYDPATGVLASDPALKVYEVQQGITPELATVLNKPAGPSFHFVLNNTVIKDNRIPPRGYTAAAYDQPGLRPVGAVYADGQYWDETVYALPPEAVAVVAILYYQTASKEYVDFLRTQGGADGATLGTLWDDRKSPPEIIGAAMQPTRFFFFPLVDQGAP